MRERRLYRQVVDNITELIDSGEYPEGSRLPTEREIAERFRVSRPTVRQSIIALEAQGKVLVMASGGVYVASQQPANLELDAGLDPMEVIESRVIIEGEAAALAATMIESEQLQSLNKVLGELAENSVAGQLTKVADRKFHSIIAQATCNQELTSIIQLLWETQERLPQFKQAQKYLEAQARVSRHQDIMDALENRDPAAARKSMRSHFVPLLEALHKILEEDEMNTIQQRFQETRERFCVSRLSTTETYPPEPGLNREQSV